MQIAHTIEDLRERLAGFHQPASVPTMATCTTATSPRCARRGRHVRVGSMFVNRLRFLPHEDFDTYPRTLLADADKLATDDCDLLFAPSEGELCPQPQTFKVQPDAGIADIPEGEFPPEA